MHRWVGRTPRKVALFIEKNNQVLDVSNSRVVVVPPVRRAPLVQFVTLVSVGVLMDIFCQMECAVWRLVHLESLVNLVKNASTVALVDLECACALERPSLWEESA